MRWIALLQTSESLRRKSRGTFFPLDDPTAGLTILRTSLLQTAAGIVLNAGQAMCQGSVVLAVVIV